MESTEEKKKDASLENMKDRYMSSFTMHALNHIVDGSIPEKILWTLKLFSALGLASYLASRFFVDYLNYEVSTTIRILPRMTMKLPILYLCNDEYWRVLDTFSDCTYGSKEYNDFSCIEMRKPQPYWYSSKTGDCGNNTKQERFCSKKDPLLMNQCIIINPERNLQKRALDQLHKKIFISRKIEKNGSNLPFPLHLGISPVEAAWQFGLGTYTGQIDGPGVYMYSVEKTTIKRLPSPYSNPSCIQEGSEDALRLSALIGRYTRKKCEDTCDLNTFLQCGVVPYFYRNYVRDKDYLEKYLNESDAMSPEDVKSCLDGPDNFDECAEKCHQPCEEKRYRYSEIGGHSYSSSESQKLNESMTIVELYVYYEELAETIITESPSYDGMTLLANFGGMLGLMTGMSALSVLEIIIWILLCTIVFIQHRLK